MSVETLPLATLIAAQTERRRARDRAETTFRREARAALRECTAQVADAADRTREDRARGNADTFCAASASAWAAYYTRTHRAGDEYTVALTAADDAFARDIMPLPAGAVLAGAYEVRGDVAVVAV